MSRTQPTTVNIYAFCDKEGCDGICFTDGSLVHCQDIDTCCLRTPTRLENCRVFALRASNGDVVVVDFDQKLIVGQYEWKKHKSGHYHRTGEDDANVYLHRLVTNFRWDLVDHINRLKWDNRRSNLRESNPAENRHNVAGKAGSASRYIGVTKVGRRWRGRIQSKTANVDLGLFDSEHEAARAVMAARRSLLGNHAYVDEVEHGDVIDISSIRQEDKEIN